MGDESMIDRVAKAIEAEREDRKVREHSHEKWQLRQDPEGRTYCAACGEQVP